MGRNRLITIGEDEEIIFYKKGCRGLVVAVYKSIEEFGARERMINHSFSNKSVWDVLVGRKKSFTSFYHSCRVVARIKKKEVFNEN